jgi:hypothetical protein
MVSRANRLDLPIVIDGSAGGLRAGEEREPAGQLLGEGEHLAQVAQEIFFLERLAEVEIDP